MTPRVLVTAGASGIGLAIARAFVAGGARVHLADIDAAALSRVQRELPGASATVMDVSREDDVARTLADVRRHLGGLDVLVNNAGIAGPTAAAAELAPDDWRRVVDVNLTGTFLVTRAAIPLLEASSCASILVMSSVAGRFGYARRAAYAASKWGLVGLARTLSLELAPRGITVNTLHPGAVDGERIRAVLAGRAAASGRAVDDELALALQNQAVPRLTDAADIAALAVFLAGPHARTISGQSFPIDGDSRAAQ